MKTIIKIKTNLVAALALLIAAPMFTSCLSDDDYDGAIEVTSLVTFNGNFDSKAQFTFIPEGDLKTRTLIADEAITDAIVKPGQRLVIRYAETGGDDVIGYISLRGYNVIHTVELEDVESEEAQAADTDIDVNSAYTTIYRTGQYINFEPYVPYYDEREYTIYVDKNTKESPMPEIYIATKGIGEYKGVKQIDMVSFDISMIWNRIDCQGVKVHIINKTAETSKVFEFKKGDKTSF